MMDTIAMSDTNAFPGRVFISHSTKNKSVADRILAYLEKHGIPCWIAPRDINAGTNYGVAIAKGIHECNVLLLVYTGDSNMSEAVHKEVLLAFDNKKHIIPIRFDKVPAGRALEFFLSGIQWIDAEHGQMEFPRLITDIQRLSQSNLIGEDNYDADFLTVVIDDDVAQSIALRNVNNPTQVWTARLDGDVVIGRHSSSQICLAEPSVSRTQCKVYLVGNTMTIENLSQSNITLLNDEPITLPTPLKQGDKIRCGRLVLLVE